VSLVAAQGVALWTFFPRLPATVKEGTFWQTLPWLGFGPFLTLQILVLQNPARLASLTGWAFPYALAWVLLCHLAAFELSRHWWPRHLVSVSLVGLGLIGSLFLVDQPSTWIVTLAWLGGQIAITILFRMMLRGRVEEIRLGLRWTGLVHGSGMMVMGGLIFAMHLTLLDQRLPIQSAWLFSFAGGIIALSAIVNVKPIAELRQAETKNWLRTKLYWGLLLCPLYVWLGWFQVTPPAPRILCPGLTTSWLHRL
jgi:hypothetical protein